MKKLLLVLFLLFSGLVFSFAQNNDTISTDGVTFTSASDTLVVQKKEPAKPAVVVVPAKIAKLPAPSLWAIFIKGFIGGVLAFFMPCIFPMLPMTIAFFTKSSGTKNSAIGKALIYGLSIIVIYVVLGLFTSVAFGADALNALSTSGVFNLFFFLVLVAFAASFLGAFELVLPSVWVNAMDAKSDKAGLAGLFFMAFTLALVSFSCTGPIIGTLLVQAATEGALLAPAIGMLGFSFALAMPFALFAMFPHWMRSLPKSGGWLNSVKVVLGFLELALSMKFLSNVDLAYHWHLFDREVFLVLWIVIAALAGFYLLGKLKFSHDSALDHIAVSRLFLAIIAFSFSMYLVPGLWGAPLRSVSALLPPMSTQDFDLSAGVSATSGSIPDSGPHKYTTLFDKPKGFNPFFDYDEGLAYAKKTHKPVMIDFTGHACVNCRKMEANVWTDQQIAKRINEDYVLIQLYVDDKTDLAIKEQTTTPQGRAIKTIGNKWSYLQTSKFLSNSQPFYVLLDQDSEQPLVAPNGADYDPVSYLKFLDSGLNAYKITHK
ncbi:MAG: cytochrome c biogenesis protein CcdA [Mucilaginibacter sp.]|uniref:protein-disulfide reductase DsbD family protein n=1 Tax=Mucilaginibacter sp. TaxID=1882438 RepID=UPI0032664D6B